MMAEMRSLVVLAAGLVASGLATGLAPGLAHAEPHTRAAIDTPLEAYTPHGAQISRTLYLDRCIGGCTIVGGTINNAAGHMTSIPKAGTYQVGEFATADGQVGAAADADWADVVTCMQEVYSPYAVTVTDVLPAIGTYTEAVIAGQPFDLGLGGDILGIAPLAGNCTPQDNVMSFSFANHHAAQLRSINICWTAAQESAHAFGLDHEFEYGDHSSSCNDPMTYRTDCGGEKFFRNRRASCGEYAARKCRCSATQNSHTQLVGVFGEGTPTTAPPHAAIVLPVAGAQIPAGTVVHATAGAQRGVAKVELFLNGSKWNEVAGAAFGTSGQPDPSAYTINLPTKVPDGILDIMVRASDDLGISGESPVVTVIKGQPCTSAATCLPEQSCDAGHCMWPAPVVPLGAACTYAQACTTWACADTADGMRCTQSCALDEPTSCPTGFACIADGTGAICVSSTGGGCCSVGGGPASGWFHAGMAGAVLGLLIRRRKR